MISGKLTLLRPVQPGVSGRRQGWRVCRQLQVSWSCDMGGHYFIFSDSTRVILPAVEAAHRSVKMPRGEMIWLWLMRIILADDESLKTQKFVPLLRCTSYETTDRYFYICNLITWYLTYCIQCIRFIKKIHFCRREETEPSCRQFRGNPECYYEDPCPATCRQSPAQDQCARYSVRLVWFDKEFNLTWFIVTQDIPGCYEPPIEDDPCPGPCRQKPDQRECAEYSVRLV